MENPTVSVVIPTHNRDHLIGNAIDSVLHQTFKDFELFVVDDASTDNTSQVVDCYDDERIKYVRHEENKHGAVARNTGIKLSQGKYVAFLDDDDEWYPSKLEKQVETFEQASDEVGLVYCWSEVYDHDELVQVRRPELKGDIFDSALTRNPIGGTPTLMVKLEVLAGVGGFDEDLYRGQDSDLIRRITRHWEVDYVPEPLIKQRREHSSDQIRDNTDSNIYNSIHCRKRTLEKFGDYLSENTGTKIEIYRKIANGYVFTHDWHLSALYCAKIFLEDPFNAKAYSEISKVANRTIAETGIGPYLPNPRSYAVKVKSLFST